MSAGAIPETANLSPMEALARSPEAMAKLAADLESGALDPLHVRYDWDLWARPSQHLPKGKWLIALMLAGRGAGKTRTLCEFVRRKKDQHPRGILVARTAADLRETLIEGESGILATAPPWDRPVYNPSKKRLTWSNGAIASLFSAEEPESLRGPQCNWFAADELAAWKYLTETWSNLMFGWRLEPDPQGFIATTPRPIGLLKELIERPDVVVMRGSSYDNRANLAPQYYANVIAPYVGTRLGRQEIDGELLMDVPGALWTYQMLEDCRIDLAKRKLPEMKRIVVAIDPAVTSAEGSNLTGIVTCGLGVDDRGYVLEDASDTCSPLGWARRAITQYRKWKADMIIGEANNGGDLIERNLRACDRSIPYRKVTATRGKVKRAEPVAALFEQGRISIPKDDPNRELEGPTKGRTYSDLIDQLRMFTPGEEFLRSPDRADALVWAFHDLFRLEKKVKRARSFGTV